MNSGLWIGGPYGVAYIRELSPMFKTIHFDKNELETKIEHAYSIFSRQNKTIVISADDGFYESEPRIGTITKLVANKKVLSSHFIEKDNYLVSTFQEIFVYDGIGIRRPESIYPELKPIKNDLLISIKSQDNNIFFLASELQFGLHIWNKKEKTLKTYTNRTKPALQDLLINNICLKSADEAFIISESYIELVNYEKNEVNTVFDRRLLGVNNSGVFMDMCKQGSKYYIGTYGLGLVILDSNFQFQKLISSPDGLNNIGIYKVFSFNDSLIAITTNNGFSLYNTKSNKVRNYFEEEGLHSNAFEETSGFQKGDTIYAGGINGFTIFDTRKYKNNTTTPKLFFNNFLITTNNNEVFDTTNLFLQKLTIPNNYTQTKIYFIGTNYQNPTRVNYLYRITERGENWIDIKNQNFIDLIGLSPGKYHLQIKAANEDGVECKPIELELHFLPKWYQTILFKILLALAVASILFVLYKFRIRQLKKVLQVRQKISQNLHNDIGSTLSAINLYTQMAKVNDANNSAIDHIDLNTKDVLDKLDDIIWATNPKNDKIKNLVERMEGFAKPLLNAYGIQFTFSHSDNIEEHKISEAIRQNLFIIFKETINNLAKHAQCKNCTVSLLQKNKTIYYSITDDGIGFDSSQPSQRNGLINLQMRVKELKGKIAISSQPSEGTTISIQLPL